MKKRSSHLNVINLSNELKEMLKTNKDFLLVGKYIKKDNIKEVLMFSLLNSSLEYFSILYDKLLSPIEESFEITSILFKQSLIHNKEDVMNFLLLKNDFNIKLIQDGCVISIQKNNKILLDKIYKLGEKNSFFSLSFKNNVCLRTALNKRNLDIILYLNDKGINPFGNHVEYNAHYLSKLIKNDDNDLIDFYLKHEMIKADHLLIQQREIFSALILTDIYPRGDYYAEKFILSFNSRKSPYKDLYKLHSVINYIYPKGLDEKIAPFREMLKVMLNRIWLNSKVDTKEYKQKSINKI